MRHPVFARVYAKRSVAQEALQSPHRQELLAGLSGRVLEIGCGNGLNFGHYPPEVTEVVAMEPEPYLRKGATAAAAGQARIEVVDGTAENLPVTGPFDAVVFSLVLCSVSDPRLVLREAKRVMAPGADVRFYEHVLAETAGLARAQRRLSWLWGLAAGGCRADNDLVPIVADEFDILTIKRFVFNPGPRLALAIVSPHVLVTARHRPS